MICSTHEDWRIRYTQIRAGREPQGDHSVDPGVSIQLCQFPSRGYISTENSGPVSQDRGRIRFECAFNNWKLLRAAGEMLGEESTKSWGRVLMNANSYEATWQRQNTVSWKNPSATQTGPPPLPRKVEIKSFIILILIYLLTYLSKILSTS